MINIAELKRKAEEAAEWCNAPQPKTVKVRVAVAVGTDGDWYAQTAVDYEESHAMEMATDGLRDDSTIRSVYWLTAELAIPEAKEVAADVEEAK